MENNIEEYTENEFQAFSNLKETQVYSSASFETEEEKMLLFNQTSNPDYKLSDFIGKVIRMKDVYAEMITITNDEDEETESPRIIIIDDKGKSYSCVSVGVQNSLKRLFATFGHPHTWKKPMPIVIGNKTIGKNRAVMTISIHTDKN